MNVYSEVPDWWYGLLGMGAFVIGIIVIEVFDTGVGNIIFSSWFCPLLSISSVTHLGLHLIHVNISLVPDSWWSNPSRDKPSDLFEVCFPHPSFT